MAEKLAWSEVEGVLRDAGIPEERIAEFKSEPDTDVERLDLDALDEVSGGGYGWGNETPPDDWKCPTLRWMTLPEGRDLINAMYNAYGFDVTVNFSMKFFEFYTDAWEESLRQGGPNYCADVIWGIHWKYTHH